MPSTSNESPVPLLLKDPALLGFVQESLRGLGCRPIAFQSLPELLSRLQEPGPVRMVLIEAEAVELDPAEEPSPGGLAGIAGVAPLLILGRGCSSAQIIRCLGLGAMRFLPLGEELGPLVTRLRRLLEEIEGGPLQLGELGTLRDDDGRVWSELLVPSRQESLDRFQDYCQALVAERLGSDARNELRIAIQELGQNAVEWGSLMKETGWLRMALCMGPDRICIRITDEGPGFDPSSLPDSTLDPYSVIADRELVGKRPGGFGLTLVRKIVDELRFNERGNVVTLEKRFR